MDEYFVLGDNRQFSLDSRRFGPIKKKEIVGRAFLRLWPIYSFAKIEAPTY
jgi:signal peptidase I